MDVFEHLILIMIIRREIINYSIRGQHFELLGQDNREKILQVQFPLESALKKRQNSIRVPK